MKDPERIRVCDENRARRVVGICQLDLEHTRQLMSMFVSTKKVSESYRPTFRLIQLY